MIVEFDGARSSGVWMEVCLGSERVGEEDPFRVGVPGAMGMPSIPPLSATPPAQPQPVTLPKLPVPDEPRALVRREGPLRAGEKVSVRDQDVAVLIRDGEVAGVLTSKALNPADYEGAHVYRVFTARFDGMRFGGPVPLDGVRGVTGEAEVQVTDPVRLVTAMIAADVDIDALDVWLPDRIMECVAEVLGQLHGRAKAHAIISGIVACTSCMEEDVGVVVRDIGRIRLLK